VVALVVTLVALKCRTNLGETQLSRLGPKSKGVDLGQNPKTTDNGPKSKKGPTMGPKQKGARLGLETSKGPTWANKLKAPHLRAVFVMWIACIEQ
jgi:hypothetical protein